MTTETEGAADAVSEDAPDLDANAPEITTEGDADPQPEGEAPKPKQTAKDRIDELTAKRREAEREAEYWRAKALQAPTTTAPAPQTPQEEQEPDPTKYEHGELDAAYIRDHATFHANKAFDAKLQRLNQERSAEQAQTAWQAKEAAAQTKYPDYQEKVHVGAQRNAWACTPEMFRAIQESDAGADLAYALANDPAEARRIASLSPLSQIRELGKLEGRLTPAPATPAKVITSAPEPGSNLKGQIGSTTSRPDDRQTTADWVAARERQLGR